MPFEITILGNSGAIPAHNRFPTSQYLQYRSKGFLIDCGEGTQMQLNKYNIKRAHLDHIFISHLHGDHFFGIFGILTSFNLNGRLHDLYIYGPKGVQEIIETLYKYSQTKLSYKVHFFEINPVEKKIIYEDNSLTVESIILEHRIPTTGFIFKEKVGSRRILPAKIEAHNIPVSEISKIKEGADFTTPTGEVISHFELTTNPYQQRSYAFCSDTIYNEKIIDQIREVDILYHETTFTQEHTTRAAETMHSTSIQAATIAKKAKVKKLLAGHFSARYENLDLLLNECISVFENTEIAIEGNTYSIEKQP